MALCKTDSQHAVPGIDAPKKPCHNCRRSRLRCDMSLPGCNKCLRAGEECLGYHKYFSWVNGVASRGKMVGKSFENPNRSSKSEAPSLPVIPDHSRLVITRNRPDGPVFSYPTASLSQPLTDPFFQDLDQSSRFYLSYYNIHVCRDLVIYDSPYKNPFRDLIPFTREYKVLLHIMLTASAFHLSNALERQHKQLTPKVSSELTGTLKSPTLAIPEGTSQPGVYQYALRAKQRALRLLCLALENPSQTNITITLACVLLFIETELIDSGKNNWKPHIEGSRKLIEHLRSLQGFQTIANDSLLDSVVSGCLVYDILGTTLTKPMQSAALQTKAVDFSPILKSAEMNNYLSCPGELLQIMQAVPQLPANISSTSLQNSSEPSCQIDHSLLLLQRAQNFDAQAWATALRLSSPRDDWEKRMHVASAHKAAVCIYIIEALRPAHEFEECPHNNLQRLVSDICYHVSFITIEDDLMKSTCWPTFVAGAATTDSERLDWLMGRLSELWDVMPWGYVRSAIELLRTIWEKHKEPGADVNWVQEMRVLGVDWLIA